MNKKGFTLAELAGAIVVIFIIVLIGVPSGKFLFKKVRELTFVYSSKNLMKATEKDCQSRIMRGEYPVLTYMIKDKKISENLQTKGAIPDEGHIILNKECDVINYSFKKDEFVYADSDKTIEDFMIKETTEKEKSLFSLIYQEEYEKIKGIYFVNNLNIHKNAIGVYDISASGKGLIKSWLTKIDDGYNLYIGSEGNIYANYNSGYLFLNSQASEIKFDNFETIFSTNFEHMFEGCLKLANLDIANWDTRNVTKMSDMFFYAQSLTRLDLSKWKTTSLTEIEAMFACCYALKELKLDSWNTSKVANMSFLFSYCEALETLKLSNFNTSNVTSMFGMFYNCVSLKDIDISNLNISKVILMGQMFYNCNSLEKLDISNWQLSATVVMTNMFNLCNSLKEIIVSNGTIATKLNTYIPARSIDEPGKIVIKNELNNVDKNKFEVINWHLYNDKGII